MSEFLTEEELRKLPEGALYMHRCMPDTLHIWQVSKEFGGGKGQDVLHSFNIYTGDAAWTAFDAEDVILLYLPENSEIKDTNICICVGPISRWCTHPKHQE
jgi:hypothetical protein